MEQHKVQFWDKFSSKSFFSDFFLLLLNDIQVCNFEVDTTIFVFSQNLAEVVKKLEENSDLIINWVQDNFMKLNTDKYHLLLPGSKHEHFLAQKTKDKV